LRNFVAKGLDATLFAENLFNKEYCTARTAPATVATVGNYACRVGTPRMWGVELSMKF
jgi:outer membrane receptor protein involved in Fe transport